MTTVKVLLNDLDKVKNFVNRISLYDCDFDLMSGKIMIEAKSIMGFFSLDLSRPVDLIIHSDNQAEVDRILQDIHEYMVTE